MNSFWSDLIIFIVVCVIMIFVVDVMILKWNIYRTRKEFYSDYMKFKRKGGKHE